MRRNLPITGRERTFPASVRLISETTRKGVITYVNDDFCEIAGYSREQLIGQAHNLIRHPDVPPAVFEDFWNTLKAGRSWLGVVKNRCSNGDHYWVNAYVSPLFEGGEHVGFQSVRTQPTREQIARAEALYSRVWKKRRLPWGGLRLSIGVPAGLSFAALVGVALGHWLTSGLGVALGAAGLAVVGGLAGTAMTRRLQKVEHRSKELFDNALGACTYGGGRDEAAYLALAQEMESARARTMLGRLEDMNQRLLTQAQTLEGVTVGTRESIDGQRLELEQVTAAMSQMAAATHQVAGSTARAADAATQAVSDSANSTAVLGRSTAAMTKLAQDVEQAAEAVERLQRESEAIRGVLDVIGGISEQTNLLALNAAIEAARAGDSGRGFAVVADEVRTLAQRSSHSTEEIRGMIDRLQAGTDAAAAAMQHSRDAAAEVGQSAGETELAIRNMGEAIETIRRMGAEIASAAEEQSATGNEISRNLEQVNVNIAATAEAVLRARQASEELLAVADSQQGMLQQFGQRRSV